MTEIEAAKAGVEALLKPYAELLVRLFGGPADELSGMMQDALRARRLIRQIKLYQKVRSAIEEAGFEPQQIQDKTWIPILQAASVEDDDFLQDQWAGMLVNAANPETALYVQSSFPHILSALSRADAVFLNAIYDKVNLRIEKEYPAEFRRSKVVEQCELGENDQLLMAYAETGLTKNDAIDLLTHGGSAKPHAFEDLIGFDIATRSLLRQQLISSRLELKGSDIIQDIGRIYKREFYFMTVLGYEFVKVCRRPMKTKTC